MAAGLAFFFFPAPPFFLILLPPGKRDPAEVSDATLELKGVVLATQQARKTSRNQAHWGNVTGGTVQQVYVTPPI